LPCSCVRGLVDHIQPFLSPFQWRWKLERGWGAMLQSPYGSLLSSLLMTQEAEVTQSQSVPRSKSQRSRLQGITVYPHIIHTGSVVISRLECTRVHFVSVSVSMSVTFNSKMGRHFSKVRGHGHIGPLKQKSQQPSKVSFFVSRQHAWCLRL